MRISKEPLSGVHILKEPISRVHISKGLTFFSRWDLPTINSPLRLATKRPSSRTKLNDQKVGSPIALEAGWRRKADPP